MSKKIVITGGAGFIGSNLVSYINELEKPHEIIIIDNYSTGSKRNHIKPKEHHKIRYVKGNTKNIKILLENERNIDTTTRFERYQLLNYLYCKIYNLK